MVGPVDILAPGGDLVIVSECSEGLGSQEYAEAQQRLIGLGPDGFLADISRKQFADVDEWQTQMQLKPMKAGSVHLYSDGLPASDRGLTGVNLIGSVRETLERFIARNDDKAIAVIPEGPYVVPVYQPA
jgi:nickel-dependent lactate racemase